MSVPSCKAVRFHMVTSLPVGLMGCLFLLGSEKH